MEDVGLPVKMEGCDFTVVSFKVYKIEVIWVGLLVPWKSVGKTNKHSDSRSMLS